MGLVKRASTLFEGFRRHRNDGRSSRRPNEPDVKPTAVRKEEKPGVPASEPRRLRLRPRRAVAIAPSEETDTMAQTATFSQQNQDRTSHRAYHNSAMEERRPIQLVEDEEDGLEGEEASDEYEDDEDDIDDSVAEDMKKLEDSFKGISQKYRLINRIGEGNLHQLLRVSNYGIDHVQEHSLQSTRPSNYFRKRTSITQRTT
jgi:hypothetical protein